MWWTNEGIRRGNEGEQSVNEEIRGEMKGWDELIDGCKV
jgi:hypothetical protein